MKSIIQGPWKWATRNNTVTGNEEAILTGPSTDEAPPPVVLALASGWTTPLRCDIEYAKAMLLIEAVPEMRDVLLEHVATMGKCHPGGLLPEVAEAFKKAQALMDRISPVRLPGVWEQLEGEGRIYIKTFATPGVWIEAHFSGARISFRAKREFLLGGVMKAAIEVARANVHACDRLEIDVAIRDMERRLDEDLVQREERNHA